MLHFLLLGSLLFAIDHFINGRVDDPRTIVVDAAVDNQARQVFKAARGREPNEDELYVLRKVWLDNEVLYREGLVLGVDKGDTAIRERVIFKALVSSMLTSSCRRWTTISFAPGSGVIAINTTSRPATIFREAVLSGDNSETAVRCPRRP
ncbi:MAG: hypothetical protein R3F40_06825 [Candidatus Competibacteraceae bacterium]